MYDVIIIGSGPSGLTAAIYAARASLKTLVIAGSPSGGQLMWTTEVENFPGFPDGIMGPKLIANMREQAKRFGVEFVEENVLSLAGEYKQGFTVLTNNKDSLFKSKSLIIATGADANWLNIESEQRLRGKGVSACATCDGFFFKDKTIAVVGGGDAAMEEADYLTKFAKKVYVLVRREQKDLKASKIMQERAFNNPKIEFVYNTQVYEVLGTEKVEGLLVKNTTTGDITKMEDIEGLFVAIGHSPATKFLKDFVDLDEKGYLKVKNNTLTSKKGVFASGDVLDWRYRQAITAAGMGCMAALDAEKFLAENN
jgi:thioredoxin reductase (NADPH)